MTKQQDFAPGQQITITAGTLVNRAGESAKRTTTSTVTIRKAEPARYGKTRVFWKSNGVLANALVK